ncbi:dUTP diphosphatase domain protein [Cooperia oncophora]
MRRHGYTVDRYVTHASVCTRSGLAAKNFIDVGAGVVDSDYRGELKVLLFNFGPSDFEFICERIAHCKYEECTTLTDTVRGEGGFGSTGK